jgi:hypothetical protein
LALEKVCVKYSMEESHAFNAEFGLKRTPRLPHYNGRSMLPLPGPISGPVPAEMVRADSPMGKKVLDSWQELFNKMNVKDVKTPYNPYAKIAYIVDLSDGPKVWYHLLSAAQRDEMRHLMHHEAAEAQKHLLNK